MGGTRKDFVMDKKSVSLFLYSGESLNNGHLTNLCITHDDKTFELHTNAVAFDAPLSASIPAFIVERLKTVEQVRVDVVTRDRRRYNRGDRDLTEEDYTFYVKRNSENMANWFAHIQRLLAEVRGHRVVFLDINWEE